MDNETLDIQEFYNDIASEFADVWYQNDSLMPVLKRFMALLPPSPRVLDLGCGAGYESMRLKRLGADVVGVDYSAEPIRIARERNPDIRFEIADFRFLDAGLGPFDGIVAVASLIHVQDEELGLVFGSMANVLTAKGLVMIVLVEGQGLNADRSFVERNGKRYKRNFYLHDQDELTAEARAKGFYFREQFELPEDLGAGWKCFVYQKEV